MQPFDLPASALDGLDVSACRDALRDAGKLDNPTLGHLAGTPSDGEIFVLDVGDAIGIGSRWNCLVAYAKYSGLDITGPVQTTSEEDAPVWELRLSSYGTDCGPIGSAPEQEQMFERASIALQELAGDQVIGLAQWIAKQDVVLLGEAPLPSKASKRPQWGERRPVDLVPLAPPAAWLLDEKRTGPQKIRRKAALEALQEPRGLRFECESAQNIATPGAWRMTVTLMDGQSHANHHDLLAALLMGLDVSHLTPYPDDVAHRFLVSEATRRAMRRLGYIELRDFDPAGMIRLRTSLPEFSEAVTGEKAPKAARLSEQQKVDWPPTELSDQPVVIVMDLARLAMDVEPEYERVVRRDILMAAGRYWVAERSRSDRPWKVRKHPQLVRPARLKPAPHEGHSDQAELELQS